MSSIFGTLPSFPKQKLLELSDKNSITLFVNQFEPYADYKFASLWSYNTENDAMISQLNNNLVLRFRDYISNEVHYSFIGENMVEETASTLLNHAIKENVLQELRLIPESVIRAGDAWNNFDVQEDLGNHDYILSVSDITHLPGSKFHTHKNHINKFNTLYPNSKIRVLAQDEQSTKDAIEEVFFKWEKGRKKDRSETIHELTAIRRILHDNEYFNLLILGLFINDEIVGFSINDMDSTVYAQNHFAKSDPTVKQVYYKLNQATGEELQKRGYEYLNIECDLGLEGLRFAKEQWNPVAYLKKYIIRFKSNIT